MKTQKNIVTATFTTIFTNLLLVVVVLLPIITTTTVVQAGIGFGPCPPVETQDSIDTTAYLGRWYEIQRDRSTPFEIVAQCVTANYDTRDDGLVSVKNCAEVFGLGGCGEARAQCYNSTGCYVSFDEEDDMTSDINYKILETDYETYTVVSSCQELFNGNVYQSDVWILARENEISDELYEELLDVISEKYPSYNNGFWGKKTWQGFTCTYVD